MVSIGRTTILVNDLDEAKGFHADAFGFGTLYDGEVAPGLRTVHVGPNGPRGAGLWLMKVTSAEGVSRVGAQTAGEPRLVFHTQRLAPDLAHLSSLGIQPLKPPVHNDGDASFAHIRDNSGNEIVLVELPPERPADQDAPAETGAPCTSVYLRALFGWHGDPDAYTMSATGNTPCRLPDSISAMAVAEGIMTTGNSILRIATPDLEPILASAQGTEGNIVLDSVDPVSGDRFAVIVDPQGEPSIVSSTNFARQA